MHIDDPRKTKQAHIQAAEPGRRKLLSLLGLLSGAATLDACGDQQKRLASLTQEVHLSAGADIKWVATVLGAAPPGPRTGDLATSNNVTLGATIAIAEGCISSGDGGGGVFLWTTGTDDGGTFIVPNGTGVGVTGSGWLRIDKTPLDVRWFGAQGTGSNDDTSAINAALAAANVLPAPANVSQTVYFPTGFYKVTSPLTPIVSNNVTLVGDGSNASILYCPADVSLLQFGTTTAVTGGGVRSLGFSYLGVTPNATTILFCLYNATGLSFSDIYVQNAGIIASIGNNGFSSGSVLFQGVRGYLYYSGSGTTPALAAFQLGSGGGFWGSAISLQVGGGAPIGGGGGIPSPVFPSTSNYGTWPMTGSGMGQLPANTTSVTPGGVNFLQIIPPAGRYWDTVYLSDCLAQLFTAGVFLYAQGGAAIEFVQVDNCTFDNCGQTGLSAQIDASGSNLSSMRLSNSIFTGWDSFGIAIAESSEGDNAAYLSVHSITGCLTHDTGAEGVYLGARVRNVAISQCSIVSPNRFTSGSANGIRVYGSQDFTVSGCTVGKTYDALSVLPRAGIWLDSGAANFAICANDAAGTSYGLFINTTCTNFTVTGNALAASGAGVAEALFIGSSCSDFTVSGNTATGSSTGGSSYGLSMNGSCDHFSVTGNNFAGGTGNTYVATDALLSRKRVCGGNGGADYAGMQTGAAWALPASGAAWQNFTAFRVEVYVYATAGSDIASLAKNGTQISAGGGSLMLNPGEWYSATYSLGGSGGVFAQYFVAP